MNWREGEGKKEGQRNGVGKEIFEGGKESEIVKKTQALESDRLRV